MACDGPDHGPSLSALTLECSPCLTVSTPPDYDRHLQAVGYAVGEAWRGGARRERPWVDGVNGAS